MISRQIFGNNDDFHDFQSTLFYQIVMIWVFTLTSCINIQQKSFLPCVDYFTLTKMLSSADLIVGGMATGFIEFLFTKTCTKCPFAEASSSCSLKIPISYFTLQQNSINSIHNKKYLEDPTCTTLNAALIESGKAIGLWNWQNVSTTTPTTALSLLSWISNPPVESY